MKPSLAIEIPTRVLELEARQEDVLTKLDMLDLQICAVLDLWSQTTHSSTSQSHEA